MDAKKLSRILVVEDEADIQFVARRALELLGGYTVETCGSGRRAVGQALDFAPDLILLDVMMPGMDGPATLRALRETPELAHIPVVFMTARVQPSEVREYRDLGAVDVIPKPFYAARLASAVREIWEHQGAAAAVA